MRMFKMNNLRKTLLAGATLVAMGGFSSQASALKISHITLGTGLTGNVSLQDTSAESIVTTAGETLTGVGKIQTLNGGSSFADAGYELNFVYTAHVAYDSGNVIVFDTGSLSFFVNTAGTFDITTSSPYADLNALATAVSGGTDFLDLATTTVTTTGVYTDGGAAPATGGFFGQGGDLAGSNPDGSGVGYMKVDTTGSGVANALFDTDTLLYNGTTPYDVKFTSTFSVPTAGTYASFVAVQDASTFTASYESVPEPGTLALMGLGCLVTVVGYRRRKPQATGTMAA
jgi:hypothetical protein